MNQSLEELIAELEELSKTLIFKQDTFRRARAAMKAAAEVLSQVKPKEEEK